MTCPRSIALLIVLVVFTVNPTRASAELFEITVQSDALINRPDSNKNFGGELSIAAVYNSNTALDRKSYLRFDLSSITQPTITSASLSLVLIDAIPSASLVFNVYGLKDGDPGDLDPGPGAGWVEGVGTVSPPVNSPGITWNNAPANVRYDFDNTPPGQYIPPGNGVDPSRTTSLGTFSLPTLTGGVLASKADTAGQTVEFSSQALIDFLQADTNNLATLIITRQTLTSPSIVTGSFASKENPSFGPPQLNGEAVPEPSSIGLIAMGFVGLIGFRWTRARRAVSTAA